ncbi:MULTISPECIES: hypothetical protein [Pseudonocardia]|uniref:Uncharacterized protein n=2 Tax=Pseudonocardia TaxID=1847 RepID=A0A1Y2N4J4_PSEAH|nr:MULTISPECIES: hypothetical protein [Pseudonocardia]OSY42059.1 hypothetical protein BG845_01555 [Pseudonocardia autotrophica]TDN75172.1 hypothetical protein C8E95_4316 [Pseudonocardia autotrophica]BBF99117.1 hypothetical protein Pdca_03270 [Pseudonocardia autotrophica]GEC24037.1 hypothetical protein PSA01_10660 [Pseudonocardia saturnea]
MIRLGSLAGYAFSGPRLLGGWTPPPLPAVYAILYRPDPDRERFAVTWVGHSEDLSAEGLPFRHRRSPCWVQRAGSKWALHIATLEVPGGGPGHRRAIAEELIGMYEPRCNTERFDPSWRAEWIGEYSDAPSTAPLPAPQLRSPAADTDGAPGAG